MSEEGVMPIRKCVFLASIIKHFKGGIVPLVGCRETKYLLNRVPRLRKEGIHNGGRIH